MTYRCPRPGLSASLLRILGLAVLLASAAAAPGCGQDADDGSSDNADDGSSDADDSSDDADDELIENECGVFDPNETGTDSVIPQDPADPEIVASCEALCEAYQGIDGCDVDVSACVETCRLGSCDVCPGSLAPLVDCEAAELDAAACTCADGVVTCEVPEACADEQNGTGACGG